MFEGADRTHLRLMQAAANALPKPPYAPCLSCGSQNRSERSFVAKKKGNLIYGCCQDNLSAVPDVDIKTIKKCSLRLW